jgi:hypothetical protein
MSTPETPELSPEAAAIIARARKSFMFTMGLLIVGFIVVGGALVYRATRDTGTPAAAAGEASYAAPAVKIPAGATIVSAVASDGTLSVTYRNGSATSLRIFDGKTGAILREIPIVSE